MSYSCLSSLGFRVSGFHCFHPRNRSKPRLKAEAVSARELNPWQEPCCRDHRIPLSCLPRLGFPEVAPWAATLRVLGAGRGN